MVYDEQLKLINMALTQIISSGIARLGPAMASGVILMLPPIIVFLLTQNSVIETMASSGIKE
jgi:ABC-type glycerol-3-phosphate transport system permease component